MPSPSIVDEITQFLTDTEDVLKWLVLDEEAAPLIPDYLLGTVREALPTVQERIGQGRDWLLEARDASPDSERQVNLETYGFGDTLWAPKWLGFSIAKDTFRDALPVVREVPRITTGGVGRVIRPILEKLLGWIDLLLGSLVKVIALLDPVKEFKETLEKAITT